MEAWQEIDKYKGKSGANETISRSPERNRRMSGVEGDRMKEKENNEFENRRDLEERTFNFAACPVRYLLSNGIEVINFLKNIRYSKVHDVIKYQLAKAATSIGANYEESQGAYSKEDFKFKISICLREAKESNYWLRIIKATNIAKGEKLDYLIKESGEFKKIFEKLLKKIHYRKDV